MSPFEEQASKRVYGKVEDMENTHNTYQRRHEGGFEKDDTEPKGHSSEIKTSRA